MHQRCRKREIETLLIGSRVRTLRVCSRHAKAVNEFGRLGRTLFVIYILRLKGLLESAMSHYHKDNKHRCARTMTHCQPVYTSLHEQHAPSASLSHLMFRNHSLSVASARWRHCDLVWLLLVPHCEIQLFSEWHIVLLLSGQVY